MASEVAGDRAVSTQAAPRFLGWVPQTSLASSCCSSAGQGHALREPWEGLPVPFSIWAWSERGKLGMLTSSAARHYVVLLSPSETGHSALERQRPSHTALCLTLRPRPIIMRAARCWKILISVVLSPLLIATKLFTFSGGEGAKWSDLG